MKNKVSIKVEQESIDFLERGCSVQHTVTRGKRRLYPYQFLRLIEKMFKENPECWDKLCRMEVKDNGFK
jgi:hypothetical protein